MSMRSTFAVLLLGLSAPALLVSSQTMDAAGTVSIPAGTRVHMAMVRPVWAKKSAPGDSVYLQTMFPVVANGAVAIPAGSYVQGTIEKLTQPSWKTLKATVEVRFIRLTLASGYTVQLGSPESDIVVQASPANDLLLDNGAQVDMTLADVLPLDAAQVAHAIPLSRGPELAEFKSASQCRDTAGSPGTPGTAGTPDTVIPGSPGTPDTVIPGADGMPGTVIPGTAATPPTVIPGMPGTPGTPGTPGYICPGPPMVLSSNPPGTAAMPQPPAAAEKTRITNTKG